MRCLFTSDTHFGHSNIIKYCERPFADRGEMNDKMIANWNTVVGHEDTVFHLGDFAFGSAEYAKDIRSRLNGSIILIKGNHDRKTHALEKVGVEVCGERFIEIGGVNLYLRHKPNFELSTWPHETKWHFHGHTHGHYGRRHHGWMIDVGVDCWGFTPRTLDEILAAPAQA